MSVSVKIDDDLRDRVRQLAAARQRSPHWVMHEAIRQYVEREEARENFRQEALASWASYQETGLHITGDELQSWLSTWGTGDETDAPECHA